MPDIFEHGCSIALAYYCMNAAPIFPLVGDLQALALCMFRDCLAAFRIFCILHCLLSRIA